MEEFFQNENDQISKISGKVVNTGVFDKQYLASALKTRIFSIGVGETKSLTAAMKHVRQMDSKYQGIHSPFYFDKVVKYQGKYFWNPFIPVFYTEAFEQYINNEISQMNSSEPVQSGITFINLDSCGSISRMNTTLDLFLTGKFKIHPNTHKLYIKWNYDKAQEYILGRFLSSIEKTMETWLVVDSNIQPINLKALASKGLKGVIVNVINEDLNTLFDDNTGYDRSRLSILIRQIRQAGLLDGANIMVEKPDADELSFCLKNTNDLHLSFVILNDGSENMTDADERKLSRAIIERTFLKTNSSKDFKNYPLVFLPDFIKRFDQQNDIPKRQVSVFTFQNGSMMEERIPGIELFKFIQKRDRSVLPKYKVVPNQIIRQPH